MDAVHAQIAGPVMGGGRATLADRDDHGARLGPDLALVLVAGALTQIVQVRHRDRRQALVAGIAENTVSSLHEFLGCQTGQRAMQCVGMGEQEHVSARVDARKAGSRALGSA